MKDVLCIGYSCPPILDPQSILLAKMLGPLREQGYRLQIVGLDPATCSARTDPALARMLPADAAPLRLAASEKRLWFRALTRCFPSLLRVPDKHLPVHPRAVRAAKALHAARPASLLFSWAQYHSCSLVALRLKSSLNLPWVAHFSDPWYEHPYGRPRALVKRINARLERAVIAGADAVVFVNEETRDWTLSRHPGVARAKAHVVPHCFDASLYPPREPPHPGMLFRHIGHFYGERGAGPLLDGIAALRDSAPGILAGVTFEFIGRVRPSEGEEVRRRGLGDFVRLRPGVGYQESLREMQESDVLILVEAPAATNLFLPSKLIDYLGAGPPIVALTPSRGPAARLLQGPGDLVVPPEDPAAIAGALRRCLQRFRAGELAGLRRDRSSVSRFACGTTMGQLARIFEKTLEQHAAGPSCGAAPEPL